MLCKILSHPETELIEHLSLVREIGLTKFDEDNIYPDYRYLIECVLFMHDLGKAHPNFQAKIREESHGDYHHSAISAQWVYFMFREKDYSPIDSFFAFFIIYSHHGNLKSPRENETFNTSDSESKDLYYDYLNKIYADYSPEDSFFSRDNYQRLKEKYSLFQNLSRMDYKAIDKLDYYKVNYLFSILIYADKKASIFKSKSQLERISFNTWRFDIVDNYRQNKFSKSDKSNLLNSLRDKAYHSTNDQVASINSSINSINLPTGMGKTLNVINVAVKLKEKLKKKRIIYALPFTSIIEQNGEVLEEILKASHTELDNTKLLKQHHLVEFYYKSSNDWGDGEGKFLIENWESEFVLTTFYQLLNTLISAKNKQLVKLNNLVDSIVILDEVQNIPTAYWLLVNRILRNSAEIFNIHFILTTATMPLIFSKEAKEITELVPDYLSYYQEVDRINLDCSNLSRKIDLDDLVEIIIQPENTNSSQLIILNSIAASLDLYEKLKVLNLDKEILYLSTNVIPFQRLAIIDRIKKDSANKILVSTQLVEAGVDIDFDIVYRDLAPLDSIFQACGRCNRNNNQDEKATVVMLELINKSNIAYWSYIYEKYAISTTLDIIKTKLIPESDFAQISQAYYQRINDYLDNSTSDKLLKSLAKLDYKMLNDSQVGFTLIKELSSTAFYICYNEEASQLLKQYNELKEQDFTDKFNKLIKLKTITRRMSKFIVNLPKRYAWNSEDNLFVVDKDNLPEYYDSNTGFKRLLQQEDWVL